MKFSAKLTLLSFGIFLVSSLIIVYFVYTTNIKALEEQIKDTLEEHAFHTMDTIDRMLFERYIDIKAFAADPVISSKKSTQKQIAQRLAAYQNQHKIYASLSFFDLNRIRIADTSGKNIGKQHSFTEYWPDIAKGKDFVMLAIESEFLKQPVFYFASIVKDKNGTPFGVVVSRIPVGKLYEITERVTSIHEFKEKSVGIDLVNKDGLLLYSNHHKGILKDISPDWKAVKKFISMGQKMGSVRHSYLGEEEISTFVRQQGYQDFKGDDWILIMCVPTKVAFALAIELRNKLAIILSVICSLVLFIVVFFSRRISRPIARLRDAALKIGKGNLDTKIEIASKDEIGELGKSFNKMAQDLKESHEQLTVYSNELEKKVEVRTDELMREKAKKEAQEQLFEKQKAQSITLLAGGIAHDFNNILTAVLGNAELLKMKLPQDNKIQDMIDTIINLSKRMGDLVRQLLAYAKGGKYQPRVVFLNNFIRETLSITSVGQYRKIEVVSDLSEDLWPVFADHTQMVQVMVNLFTNAFEATAEKGGQLTVHTSNVKDKDAWECSLKRRHPRGDYVYVSVSDTGHGISPEIQRSQL
ncbi:MAG: HAMP domain-containing protein [Nitrospirae bacterium]|nr:HAMP domain-containing protein [Nitrospirota bacterium]